MFNNRIRIKKVLDGESIDEKITVMGWVRTFRNNQFIALNDGSTNNNLQVVAELGRFDDSLLKRITTGASVKVSGDLIPSLGKGQTVELKAATIEILGDSDAEKFPLQPKKHSLEFLREIAHLRFRTNTFGSIFRVRHSLAFAVHKFFNDKGFVYLHTPVITASDAEGAGETFHVTNFDLENPVKNNPMRNEQRAKTRRDVVLEQMLKTGYLDQQNYDKAIATPIDLDYHPIKSIDDGYSAYYKFYLRKEIDSYLKDYEKKTGKTLNLFKDGLKIYVTLD